MVTFHWQYQSLKVGVENLLLAHLCLYSAHRSNFFCCRIYHNLPLSITICSPKDWRMIHQRNLRRSSLCYIGIYSFEVTKQFTRCSRGVDLVHVSISSSSMSSQMSYCDAVSWFNPVVTTNVADESEAWACSYWGCSYISRSRVQFWCCLFSNNSRVIIDETSLTISWNASPRSAVFFPSLTALHRPWVPPRFGQGYCMQIEPLKM